MLKGVEGLEGNMINCGWFNEKNRETSGERWALEKDRRKTQTAHRQSMQ